MAWYSKFIESLEGELGTSPRRLLELIFAEAERSASNPLSWSASKKAVLAALAEQESPPPRAEAVRARLHQINLAARAKGSPAPAFEIRSRKDSYQIDIREGVEDELARQQAGRLAEQSSDADAIRDTSQYVEPTVFASPRTFQVFVSHAHESAETEGIVRAFVEQLGRKLANPPGRYRDMLRISLWLDHDRMGGARSFADQAHPECERSELGLFLLSDRFFHSAPCKGEVAHFVGDSPRHMQVQLSGKFARDDPYFGDKPCYPAIWRQDVGNLLRAWELGPADRDEFLTRLRDDIIAEIVRLHFPDDPPSPESPNSTPKQPRKAGATVARTSPAGKSRHEDAIEAALVSSAGKTRHEDVIVRDKTENPAVTREEGSGDPESAVDLLAEWAVSPASTNRIFALLGSFGAGKTTASQLFVRELLRRREKGESGIPVPVYLDFRRLNEAYAQDGASPPLADIIRSSLSSDIKDRIDPDQLVAFLRREPSVIVFDGLDEIGTRIGVERMARLYRELLEIVPNAAWESDARIGQADWSACPARILVTCRTHFFRTHVEQQSTFADRDRHRSVKGSSSELVRTLYMAPFTPDQIRSYFGKELGEAEGERIWRSLSGVGDLEGLATRPIMARYIAELAPDLLEDIAKGRAVNAARVYELLFERAVERDNDKRPLLKPRDRSRLLEDLAERLWLDRKVALPIEALEDWFDAHCEATPGLRMVALSRPDARGLLQTELRNANLLVRSDKRDFGFVHTSFQEYFLARKLKARLESGALEEWPDAPEPSRETRQFLLDLFAIDHEWQALRTALDNCLRTGRPIFWRALCARFWSDLYRRGQDYTIPLGADLRGLDLRDRLWSDEKLSEVDLRDSNLLGTSFQRMSFLDCRIEGSNWSNTTVEDSDFEGCRGRPRGVASARFAGCSMDDVSAAAYAERLFVAPANGERFDPASFNGIVPVSGPADVNRAAFSPDGRTILTVFGDRTARLWDIEAGAELRLFTGHHDRVQNAVFSPDGRTVLTASRDQTARLWDTWTGAELRRFEGHAGSILCAAYSPDARTVLTASADETVRIWDSGTGAELCCFAGHLDTVQSAVFSPDGRTVLTASDDHSARLWDIATGAELRRFEGHGDWIRNAAFSPDARAIITASDDQTARLWDATTGAEIRRFEGHHDYVRHAVFSPDAGTILTASDDGTTRLWDTRTGSELRRFEARYGFYHAVFSPDARTILTASSDRTARLWDVATGVELRRFKGRTESVHDAIFDPAGLTILTTSNDRVVRIRDLATGTELRNFGQHGGMIQSAMFSPDGRFILTTWGDRAAQLWNASSGAELRRFEGHEDWVRSAAFSPDGRVILTASDDKTARLWDLDSGAELRRFEGHDDWVQSAAFSPDARFMVTASDDGTARLWNVETGAELRRFVHDDYVRTAMFSPDAFTILTASNDGTARLWDARTGSELRRFEGHDDAVSSAVFSSDSQFVLTASDDRTARLWNPETGAELRRFAGHRGLISSARFSFDAHTILTASNDGTIRLWNAETGELLRSMQPLEDACAFLDGDDNVIGGSGKLWKYVHRVLWEPDGSYRVVNPWADQV